MAVVDVRAIPPRGAAMGTAAATLLDWYDGHARDLPWRVPPGSAALPEPYRVWLSEIMLQQTTTGAVAPYYARFLERWPDVAALAAASEAAVMNAWAGLGYYARARNLLRCARAIMAEHGGRFPDTEAGLRALPGIGAYTAAAVAAIAFGRRAVVVDGNVERVVSRLHAIETPLPLSRPEIRSRMDEMTLAKRPGDFAQAMMDLGATICTPTRPACMLCPFAPACLARQAGLQEVLPRKVAKAARPFRTGVSFVAVRADGALLLRTRPAAGLLGGMTDFPGEWPVLVEGASQPAPPFVATWRDAGRATHGFTHFDMELRVFRADAGQDVPATAPLRWVAAAALTDEAWPTLVRKIAGVAGVTFGKPQKGRMAKPFSSKPLSS